MSGNTGEADQMLLRAVRLDHHAADVAKPAVMHDAAPAIHFGDCHCCSPRAPQCVVHGRDHVFG